MTHTFLDLEYIHTTGGIIHSYRHLAKRPCPLTTVQGSYAALRHSGETPIYFHLPDVAVLHQKMTESQPYIHCRLHLQLTWKEIHLHMPTFSADAHSTKFRDGNYFFKNFSRTCKVMDDWLLHHKVAYEPQTVVEGQGCFTKCL